MTITVQQYIKAAEARGWHYEWIDEYRNFVMFHPPGEQPIIIRNNHTELGSAVGVMIAQYKSVASRLAEKVGFRIPETIVLEAADSADIALPLLRQHGRLAIKPMDGAFGEGVSTQVNSPALLQTAVQKARAANVKSQAVIAQEFCPGKDFRLIVLEDRVIAAIERQPFGVTGNGHDTAGELIDAALLRLAERPDSHIQPVKTNRQRVKEALQTSGYESSDIIPAGTRLRLADSANLSQGGLARDVMSQVNDKLAAAAVRLARLCQLGMCGIDLLAADISATPGASTYFIELNHAPGFRGHAFPAEGGTVDIAGQVFDAILRRRASQPRNNQPSV